MKKQRRLRIFVFLILSFTYHLSPTTYRLFAQDSAQITALSKQIMEAKTSAELSGPFAELKEIYFQENKYNDFSEFLKSLGSKKSSLEPFIDYYLALTRYEQLKYLEEKQLWDEYFSQGNTYRDEITLGAQKTIAATAANEALNISARLLLWQFHEDMRDTFAQSALANLMNAVSEYAKASPDTGPLKQTADKLLSYGEKSNSRELYKIYVGKIINSRTKDEELANIASGFYKEGNLELAEAVYDAYINRLVKSMPKEKSLPLLVDLAKSFTYIDAGPCDPDYAEQIFKKIEDIGGKSVFNQELIYLRAFNLEKLKEYTKAKDWYLVLARQYPQNPYADEANFKIAVIYTYILRDLLEGRNYFQALAKKETLTPQVISAFYQLGLFSQWEGGLVKAKEYYDKLLLLGKENFGESVKLARERLQEIEENKPLEYNLKTFLDASLKDEYSNLEMAMIDLTSRPSKAKKDTRIKINSTGYTPQGGCMQVELQYLWSGDLGQTPPTLEQSSFETNYTQPGTKGINLVVASPTGIIGRSIDLVDVE